MRDVVVALPSSVGLKELAEVLADSPFEVVGQPDEHLAVRLDDEVVQFALNNSLSEHYEEPEELAWLAAAGREPNFFLVTFKSTKALARVLEWTVNRPDACVDNDFGIIESGRDFVQRFKEAPNWDWV